MAEAVDYRSNKESTPSRARICTRRRWRWPELVDQAGGGRLLTRRWVQTRELFFPYPYDPFPTFILAWMTAKANWIMRTIFNHLLICLYDD
jgi:hypothetical protein